MSFATDIDAAARRQRGDAPAPPVPAITVTPALIRTFDGRARALRAKAQSAALCWLFRLPLVGVGRAISLLRPSPGTSPQE